MIGKVRWQLDIGSRLTEKHEVCVTATEAGRSTRHRRVKVTAGGNSGVA